MRSAPSLATIIRAGASREFLSHRLNRFLYAHIALVLTAGFLPMLTPGDGLVRGAPWWLLHAVLYAISLSALLLGLSSAQAESEEFTWLLGQPRGIGPWLAGKTAALAVLIGVASLLLVVPSFVAGGASSTLLVAGAGAAGVSIVCALAGLALGFRVRDPVRGLIAALVVWFVLLFGTDLLLLGSAGETWAQTHPDLWVAPLMINPLDAFRITVLFAVERAAFTGFATGQLTGWWVTHASLWLTTILATWTSVTAVLAWLGARRRTDG
jgi:hypothetical protein